MNITRQRKHRNEASFERKSKASVGANLGVVRPEVQSKLRIGGLSDAEYVRWKNRDARK